MVNKTVEPLHELIVNIRGVYWVHLFEHLSDA